MPEESQVEGCKYQDDADIEDQAFPDAMSKERDVDADGYHYQHVKRGGDLSFWADNSRRPKRLRPQRQEAKLVRRSDKISKSAYRLSKHVAKELAYRR